MSKKQDVWQEFFGVPDGYTLTGLAAILSETARKRDRELEWDDILILNARNDDDEIVGRLRVQVSPYDPQVKGD
jgi:hypothetical protein